MMDLSFATNDGRQRAWAMIVADVKKALKSIALTCDGDGSDEAECNVLFTRRGGRIKNLSNKEVVAFDRTGNTYGMEAWVHVGKAETEKEPVFSRPGR